MEPNVTRLMFTSIKLKKKLIVCLLFFLLTSTAGATEYIVKPAPSDQAGASIKEEKVIELEDFTVYWQFILWLSIINVLSATGILLYTSKLIFAIVGFKITEYANVFDNPNRSSVYAYIKVKPGAYISEIADNIDLNRGTLRYHLKILESGNMIEAHCDHGKVRYFQSNSTYEEKEKQIISALQNEMTRKIISKILQEECNTNRDLVHVTRISKGTITWYMKQLKELDLVEENKVGRIITYSINPAYKEAIKKHT